MEPSSSRAWFVLITYFPQYFTAFHGIFDLGFYLGDTVFGGEGLFFCFISSWFQGWKRYHAELAYKWNVFDFEAEDEVLRPEFQFRTRKNLKLNPVTQNNEPHIPTVEKGLRFVCSGMSVLFFVSFSISHCPWLF